MPTISRSIAAIAVLLLLDGAATAATDVDDLYRAQAIVTGEREETRGPGLAECLENVLVKVSGDLRLIGDPRVAAMAGQAGTLVSAFRYHDRMEGIPNHDEQGSRDRPYDLIVTFDRARIDAALRSLGREPWTVQRPRTVVFLGMRNLTTAYMVAADGDRELERDALTIAAAQRGMPMTLPNQATLVAAGLSFETLPTADLSSLDATAKKIGGDFALVGRLVWSDAALAWVGDWRLRVQDKTHQFQARGVTFDDGFRKAMGGAAQVLSGNLPSP